MKIETKTIHCVADNHFDTLVNDPETYGFVPEGEYHAPYRFVQDIEGNNDSSYSYGDITKEKAEQRFQNIVTFLTNQHGPISPKRYYKFWYRHSGEDREATVGDAEPLTGKTVVAILRSARENGPFFICTPTRAFFHGEPINAFKKDTRAIEFEMDMD